MTKKASTSVKYKAPNFLSKLMIVMMLQEINSFT